MILQFPKFAECFGCRRDISRENPENIYVAKVPKCLGEKGYYEIPLCEECPKPPRPEEDDSFLRFLGAKRLVKASIRGNWIDNDDCWSNMLGMFQRIYTEDQFRELQRIITLGRGRNLRLVK
jgi:hypothetical protein